MSRVLFINPECPFNANKSDSWIRHGLGILSAICKNEGHVVGLIDLRLIRDWKEYDKLVFAFQPDIVAITSFSAERWDAVECARRVKQNYSAGTVVIGGGIHVSIDSDFFKDTKFFDYLIKGEGEITFPEILKNASIQPETIVTWGVPPDLDKLPFIDRELWPDFRQKTMIPPPWLKDAPWIDVLAFRGCNGTCRFCSGEGEKNHYTREGPNGTRIPYLRGRSVDNVIKELLYLDEKYHYKSIHFDDDQFIMNVSWVRNFCKAMKENGLDNKKFWMGTRADTLLKNKNLILELKDVGLDICSVGFESFSDELLKFWDKRTTVAQNYEAAEFLNNNDIRIFSNVIMGAPRADGTWHISDDYKNIEAMKTIKPAFASWSVFTASPGTALYNWANDLGLNVATNDGWRGANETKIKGVNYRKIRIMMDQIESVRRPFYHTLYDHAMIMLGR